MAFLNPLFLFGLLAAGIPLLIHLWNRRRVVTIDFSSLMFLTAAHRENARRFQLRQLLILLLRMAIVAIHRARLGAPVFDARIAGCFCACKNRCRYRPG